MRTRLLRQGAQARDAFVRERLADSVVLETAFRGSVSERRRFSMSVLLHCNARFCQAAASSGKAKDKREWKFSGATRVGRPRASV